MNRYCYRIIFNKIRGIPIVVSELSHRNAGKAAAGVRVATHPLFSLCASLKKIALLTGLTLGWVCWITSSYANTIQVDKNAATNQRPTIIDSANGSTQINIQTPTGNGLSHNKFTQFDVSEKGVILNNSNKDVQTELGGYIKGNEFLRGSTGAQVILNEVNSKDPSKLNGVIEVAGQKAQVIIANAAGITCDGCGFINASRATLTTGQPIIENGKVVGYNVEQGKITISGQGMDSSRQDYTDLIAQTVSINSAVWANDVNVVAGRNKVSADSQTVEALADNGQPKPDVAIDVSALGGMYAGKIRMVGTQEGVGVRNSGELGSSAGNVSISSNGKIDNFGTISAQQNVVLASQQQVNNHNQIAAKGSITLQAKGDITNQGTMSGGKDIIAESKTGQIVNKGAIQTQQNIQLTAQQQIVNEKQLAAQGNITLKSGGAITNSHHAEIVAQKSIDMQAVGDITNQGQIKAQEDIKLVSAASIKNQGIIAAQGSLTIQAQDNIDNQGTLFAQEDMVITSEQGAIDNEGTVQANQSLSLNAGKQINNQGELLAKGDISLDAGQSVSNGELAILGSKGSITITAGKGALDNRGDIQADQSITLSIQGDLHNYAQIYAHANLAIDGGADITNQGQMGAGNDVNLTGQTKLINLNTLTAGNNMTIDVDQLVNKQLIAAGLDAQGNRTEGQGDLAIEATIAELYQKMQAGGNARLNINSMTLNESDLQANTIHINTTNMAGKGDFQATQDITLHSANSLTNLGNLVALHAITLTSAATVNNAGTIVAGDRVSITGADLINQQTGAINAPNMQLYLSRTVDNQGMINGDTVVIQTNTLSNYGPGHIYGTDLAIEAITLNNIGDALYAPVIGARHALQLGVKVLNNKTHAILMSLGDLAIGGQLNDTYVASGRADIINNLSATIEAQGNLTIDTDILNNINEDVRTEWAKIDEQPVSSVDTVWSARPIDLGEEPAWQSRRTDQLTTVYQTEVTSSDPAKIQAKGHVTLNANHITNQDSYLLAGRELNLSGTFYDVATQGVKRTVVTTTHYLLNGDLDSPQVQLNRLSESYDNDIPLNLSQVGSNQQVLPSEINIDAIQSPLITSAVPILVEHNQVSVRTINVSYTVPNDAIYIINSTPQGRYIVETDPQFTHYKKWLGSDYMVSQLQDDPNARQKTLGDGYYELQLLREQIQQLTGQDLLSEYHDDVEQYKALMDNGMTFAKAFNLKLGVGLTTEQMKVLTSDMVWLVSKDIMISGVKNAVLVPQVYIVNRPAITNSGVLSAGSRAFVMPER